MANNANIMSIAPNQPATSPRTTSQGTQPKYKAASRTQARTTQRAGKKNFGATLDKINAKLDEIKQNIQSLKETEESSAQIDPDAKEIDTEAKETPAQGKSETPHDAPQEEKVLSTDEKKVDEKISPADKPKDTKSLPEEEELPAEISFVAKKFFYGIKKFDTKNPPTVEEKSFDATKILNTENPPVVEEKSSNATKIFDTSKLIAEEIPEETPPEELVNNQPAEFLAASSMAYPFGMNSESLLATKSFATPEVTKVEGVQEVSSAQNLMTLMPQKNNDNAQSMLNMLGSRSWRAIEIQPAEVSSSRSY